MNQSYTLIQCSPKVYVNLIPLNTTLRPQELINLQENYQKDDKLLVHLWEDVLLLNEPCVLSRMKSFLGLNQTFYARKTKLIEVGALKAAQFFNTYHLQGFVNAKYYYGLTLADELVSLAGFSDLRPMKSKGINYTSAELVRFASKEGCTIVGGLSKLIKHFLNLKNPNDLMSYADRDWSLGKGYDQLGFELTAITPPAYLFVDEKTRVRYFPHRLPKRIVAAFDQQKELNLDQYLMQNGFAKAFNTGNLKYNLYV